LKVLHYKTLNSIDYGNRASLLLMYDKIHLFYTFQRMYHCIINRKKTKLINKLIIKSKLLIIIQAWTNSYNIQLSNDCKLDVLIRVFIPKLRKLNLRNAINKIKLNVRRIKEFRIILIEMKSKIKSNKSALRSLYVLYKPLYLKGFLIFQSIYYQFGVKMESLRKSEIHYINYLKYIGIKIWFNRVYINKLNRKKYSKNKLIDLNEINNYKHVEFETIKTSILSRSLWKWKGFANSTSIRIYYSLSDMLSSQLKYTNNATKLRYKKEEVRQLSIKTRNISSCQLLRSKPVNYNNDITNNNQLNSSRLSNFTTSSNGAVVPTGACFFGGFVRCLSIYIYI
jgi:hypothetical protein